MMKNIITNIFVKLALVAGLAVAFTGNVWADTKTEGFESASTSTTYNSTVTVAANKSDCGIGWSIYYGTVSTNSKISGNNSAQMRWYSSATSNRPYIKTTTAVDNLTKIAFNAKVGNANVKMDVAYSTDGTNWTNIQTGVEMKTSSSNYAYDIPTGGKYIKIGVSSSSTAPSSGNYTFIIDDVVFTYSTATPTYSITAVSNNNNWGTVSLSGSIITGSPATGYKYASPAYTVTDGTATVVQNGNNFTVTPSSDCTVQINFEAKPTISGYSIDFENDLEDYVDWEITNAEKSTGSITAHGGTYYATTGGKQSASFKTKEKVTYPDVFTCYVSKTSGNTTASTWKIQVSSDGSTWTDVASQSATSMTQGNWTQFSASIKNAKHTNVYVRLFYTGSTAVRTVDDISLTTYVPSAVEAPSISVPSEFTFSTTATITCDTDGATIYYSFDNSNWTEYTEALAINSTTTIYAKAIKGDDESAVSQATATKVLATPNVTISATSINVGETATVSTDGPAVTLTSSSNDIASVDGATVTGVAAGSATITATWSADADYNSGSKEFVVTVFDPNAPGTQNNPYTVSQARAAIDAGTGVTGVYATGIVSEIVTVYSSTYHNISYNISSDGLTTSDQLQAYRGKSYNGNNFTSADDIQVGDIVVVYGNLKKYNSTYEFDQNNQLVSLVRKPAAPTFSPAAGAVIAGTGVTISTTTDDATIYYTTDGTEPTTESSVYSAAIEINEATTIKAIAVKDAVSSDVATADYTIAAPVATPTFSPAAGTYTSVQNVEISCETEGATIYYTTNGDTPTTSSTPYSGAIYVNETMTIKAIAVKDGMANSAVAEAAYTINIPSIVFDEATNPFNVEYSASSANIHFNASHTIGDLILVLCDSEGNATTYDWFSASISGENVAASWQANADTENSRTAYFKLTADNAVSAIFAVVQAKLVVDYATLPFEWNGGTAAGLNARTGVTVDGAGKDYADSNAPYQIKFDSAGDYILVKTNSRPGVVSIGVKMLGGATTSKLKVQESTDGSSFTDVEELTISGAQNDELSFETSKEFATSARYVKIIKSVHGSNIGIGPISITAYVAPSTDPAISAEDVNIGCNDTEGSISFTISNPVNGGVVTASKEADWLTLDTIDGGSVPFTCTANTGDVRSATVTLTYTYNTNQKVTKDVTVTQAAYVVTTKWALTDLSDLTADDVFIIVENSGSTSYALSNKNGTTSAPSAVAVDASDSTWEGVIADDLMWNMQKINDSYVFYPNGSTDTWLYCTNTNNGVRVGTNDNNKLFSLVDGYLFNSATSRYVGVYSAQDWRCYDNTTGNIAGQTFAFYKQVVSSGVATSVTVTCKPNGGRNWGTFYSGQAQYVIPDNVPAKAYTMYSAHQLYLLGENGHIIPRGVAVIIISDVESVTLNAVFKGSASVSNTNILVGSDTPVDNNGKQYVLGIKNGELKFYLLQDIAVPAGKAYYIVNE